MREALAEPMTNQSQQRKFKYYSSAGTSDVRSRNPLRSGAVARYADMTASRSFACAGRSAFLMPERKSDASFLAVSRFAASRPARRASSRGAASRRRAPRKKRKGPRLVDS